MQQLLFERKRIREPGQVHTIKEPPAEKSDPRKKWRKTIRGLHKEREGEGKRRGGRVGRGRK